MSQQTDKERLLRDLAQSYRKHARKRLIMAIAGVVILSLVVGGIFYLITKLVWLGVVVSLISALVSLNFAIVIVVPPSDKTDVTRDLIYDAVCEPSRIRVFDMQRVHLSDETGNLYKLSGFDQAAWRTHVVPYFLKQIIREGGDSPLLPSGQKMTSSERKYLGGLKKELSIAREELEERQKELADKERELESREKLLEDRESAIGASEQES